MLLEIKFIHPIPVIHRDPGVSRSCRTNRWKPKKSNHWIFVCFFSVWHGFKVGKKHQSYNLYWEAKEDQNCSPLDLYGPERDLTRWVRAWEKVTISQGVSMIFHRKTRRKPLGVSIGDRISTIYVLWSYTQFFSNYWYKIVIYCRSVFHPPIHS